MAPTGASDNSQAWHAVATANTVEARLALLMPLEKTTKPILASLLECGSPPQDRLLLLLARWPYFSRVKDQLLMQRVLQKMPLTVHSISS